LMIMMQIYRKKWY